MDKDEIFEITLNKLVRDGLLDNFKKNNIKYKSRVLSKKEIKLELLNKLIEEVKELQEHTSQENFLEELCDVWDILNKILVLYHIDLSSVIRKSSQKAKERGGFNRNIFIETITIAKNNESFKFFKNYPQKAITNKIDHNNKE